MHEFVLTLRLAEVYRARVVDATISSFVFEVTGGSEKIDKFLELMREVGLVEVPRQFVTVSVQVIVPAVGRVLFPGEALVTLR